MSPTSPDHAVAFARAALARRLTTKEHAEECVKIARDAERRGKGLTIEEVFVRKGYLRRPEAQAILRSLAEPRLELAPTSARRPTGAAASSAAGVPTATRTRDTSRASASAAGPTSRPAAPGRTRRSARPARAS